MISNLFRKEELTALRENYPPGTRLELIEMDDPQAPPQGTKGTVRWIDDMGHIGVHWDNGSGLNLVPSEDVFRVIKEVK